MQLSLLNYFVSVSGLVCKTSFKIKFIYKHMSTSSFKSVMKICGKSICSNKIIYLFRFNDGGMQLELVFLYAETYEYILFWNSKNAK